MADASGSDSGDFAAPPTSVAEAEARRALPRCPTCFYLLRGRPEVGVCPECGAAYDPKSRFDYLQGPSFGKSTLLLLWPMIAVGVVLFPAAYVSDPSALVVIALLLIPISIISGSFVMYRAQRRRRIVRLGDAARVGFGSGLIAQSVGCATLATVGMTVVVLGGSCAYLLTSGL